ncbi:MAG: hypothetical protein ABIT01_20470, partial [Thermoanaerobaculia bacterium]
MISRLMLTLKRALVALAILRLVLGLVGYAVLFFSGAHAASSSWAAGLPMGLYLLHALVYGSAAALLFFGGRHDPRAQNLALFFLLIAAAYGGHPVLSLVHALPGWLASLLTVPWKLALDAFLPLSLWLFVRDFPESSLARAPRAVIRWGIGAAAVTGAILLPTNAISRFLPALAAKGNPLARVVSALDRWKPDSLYYAAPALLIVASFAVILWKARTARGEERRRVGLFLSSLVVGLTPIVAELLLEAASSRYAAWARTPAGKTILSIFIFSGLLSVPLTTTYAVLVHEVLDVRLIVRKALRYALARTTLVAAAAVPFALLGVNVYVHRAETITGFLSGRRPALLLLAAAGGIFALLSRRRLLEAIDRRFFRESFDA